MDNSISIIVPVYNTGGYLVRCLESLIAQTYQNIEIILVDDGSTDGRGAGCDDFARRNGRIRVIHQQNSGVSAARNAGLETAEGEYVFFLDSDDILPSDSLERLLTEICPGGLVSGSMRQLHGEVLCEEGLHLPDQRLSPEEMLYLLFHEDELGYQGFLWNKLFDLRLIREHGLRFNPAIRYNEDRLFVTQYLIHCTRAAMISDVVYQYRIHAASAQGQLLQAFKPAMLTELDAFELMYELLFDAYPALALRVARLCFEKALYWMRHISSEHHESRVHARCLLRSNAKRCLKDPKSSPAEKIKVAVHCILER